LNNKSAVGHLHGIAEISGASITTVELNYSSGLTGNIQSQLNSITTGYLALAGGTMTGAIGLASGTAGAPSLRFSASTTTGLYRAAGDQIGITIAGTAYGTIDATGVNFGIATTGAPSLRATSPGVSNPTYSFVGDTDTGMYRVGANSIGFAANGTNYMTVDAGANTITIGGATSVNAIVTPSGMWQGAHLIASATINFKNVGNTALYTVPTGRRLMVTHIYVAMTTIAGSGTNPVMNVGITGSFQEIVDGTNNPNIFNSPVSITTTGQVLPIGNGANSFPAISGASGANYQFISAASVLTARVATATTGYTTYTGNVYVMGFEF
jgi:hypothetical protein